MPSVKARSLFNVSEMKPRISSHKDRILLNSALASLCKNSGSCLNGQLSRIEFTLSNNDVTNPEALSHRPVPTLKMPSITVLIPFQTNDAPLLRAFHAVANRSAFMVLNAVVIRLMGEVICASKLLRPVLTESKDETANSFIAENLSFNHSIPAETKSFILSKTH